MKTIIILLLSSMILSAEPTPDYEGWHNHIQTQLQEMFEYRFVYIESIRIKMNNRVITSDILKPLMYNIDGVGIRIGGAIWFFTKKDYTNLKYLKNYNCSAELFYIGELSKFDWQSQSWLQLTKMAFCYQVKKVNCVVSVFEPVGWLGLDEKFLMSFEL